jgi:hypothetical protein
MNVLCKLVMKAQMKTPSFLFFSYMRFIEINFLFLMEFYIHTLPILNMQVYFN